MKLSHAWTGVFIFIIFSLFSTNFASAAGTLSTAEIVAVINQERTSRGLSTLRVDAALSRAAQSRSAVLAQNGRIFHVTAPKDTPWPEISQVGYSYSFAGENLALGIETPEELASRWMASPTHRENILEEEFEDIGVGVTVGNYEGMTVSYVVSYYGKKKTGATVTTLSPATPVISSASVKVAPKAKVVSPIPVKATKSVKPIKKARILSPVLSSEYTLETMPPALPDISSTPSPGEERVRLVDQLIAIFDSYLRTMRFRIGFL